jgi:hypothetical protein
MNELSTAQKICRAGGVHIGKECECRHPLAASRVASCYAVPAYHGLGLALRFEKIAGEAHQLFFFRGAGDCGGALY